MLKTIQFGLERRGGGRAPEAAPAARCRVGRTMDAHRRHGRVYRDQALAFRRQLEIDVRRVDDLSRDRVLVIPSPARRQEPAGWVHELVPLVSCDPDAGAGAITGMGV
jgi:hypothetical protein